MASNVVKSDSLRKLVVELALKNTGVCEIPVNYGKVIDKYRSVAMDRTISKAKDAWCAYFVGYIYKTYKIDVKKTIGKGYIQRAADWFTNEKRLVWKNGLGSLNGKNPKLGDVVGYKFTSGRISHIGILIEWNEVDGYALVVEGNTTPRNTVTRDENKNDCVRLKKRPISMIYVIANVIDK